MNESSNVIVGLGDTGLSLAKYFIKQGITFSVVDSRENPPNMAALKVLSPSASCFFGGFDESVILSATTLYLSPGIDSRLAVFQMARKKGIKISSDIEVFVQCVSKPILAVTGSNGKTTVTTLLTQCINACGYKALAVGNVGAPVLDHLDVEADYYVIELSSFQLALLNKISCHTAVVLNLSPDHLDRHDGYADYYNSKMKVYENALNRIVNIDDENVMKLGNLASNAMTVSVKSGDAKYYCDAKNNLVADGNVVLQADDLTLKGRHNYFNVLVVLAFCDLLFMPRKNVLTTLKIFHSLNFRCECVAKHHGVTWLNDSKATNVAASMAAIVSVLEMQPKQLVLIMGGQAKGQDFSSFAQLNNKVITDVILLGESSELLSESFEHIAKVGRCHTLREGLNLAQAAIIDGGVVLFSPACASFDMFDNYIHRGMVFDNLVKEMIKQ